MQKIEKYNNQRKFLKKMIKPTKSFRKINKKKRASKLFKQ